MRVIFLHLIYFQRIMYFYSPWKHQKNYGFLMFSGGIELDYWFKMGKMNKYQWCVWYHTIRTAWRVSKCVVFSGPYFPVFGLNMERYPVSLCIQSECRKMRTRKNSLFGHFSSSVTWFLWCYRSNKQREFSNRK